MLDVFKQAATQQARGPNQEGMLVMHAFCARSKILVEPPVVVSDDDIEQVANALE
jgi:hypothetical protein